MPKKFRPNDVARIAIGFLTVIRRRIRKATDRDMLDRFYPCFAPSMARLASRMDRLPWYTHRTRTSIAKKQAVVFQDLSLLVQHYWELVRRNEDTGIAELMQRIEHYASLGWDDCQLRGEEHLGYYLYHTDFTEAEPQPKATPPIPPMPFTKGDEV